MIVRHRRARPQARGDLRRARHGWADPTALRRPSAPTASSGRNSAAATRAVATAATTRGRRDERRRRSRRRSPRSAMSGTMYRMRKGWPSTNAAHGTRSRCGQRHGNERSRRAAAQHAEHDHRRDAAGGDPRSSSVRSACERPSRPPSVRRTGDPSALFSGTKKSLETNHAPTTTRLKTTKATIATNGIQGDARHVRLHGVAGRALRAARASTRRPARAQNVTGHAS